jgi:phosphatidate cytidylyltransferase
MAASNLTIRLATAAVALPLLLALLFVGPAWGWLLFLLFIAAVGAYELFGMTHPGDAVARAAGIALLWAVLLGFWFGADDVRIVMTVFIALPIVAVLLALWRLGEVPSAALRLAASVFGPIWLGGGLGSIALLRVKGGPAYVVLALMLAWISDTGAYFAGRAFGKHKLYEKVSPKKTIEGAIGGVVATVAASVAMHFTVLPELPLRDAIALGAVGSVLGMFGDLGESLLKRSVGVKDSGGIVPGHGGILDRVDAVLVTSSIVMLYLLWRSAL